MLDVTIMCDKYLIGNGGEFGGTGDFLFPLNGDRSDLAGLLGFDPNQAGLGTFSRRHR